MACDEAYCDACWRKVHAKGKRRFHPFSTIYSDGSVDARLVTIDGEQVDHYDASFLQQKAEADESLNVFDANNVKADGTKFITFYFPLFIVFIAPAGQESEEWTTAYDYEGNVYYYNNYTGVSQYESPFE